MPKDPKQQVFNIFAISHRKFDFDLEFDFFLPSNQCQRFLQIYTITLDAGSMPKFPNFLQGNTIIIDGHPHVLSKWPK